MNSSRLLIAQGLQAMIAGVMNGANPLYDKVKLGALFDPTGFTSWAEIAFVLGKSKPVGSGGNQIGWRIEDNPLWRVISGWDYDADSTAAMTSMLTTMDILVPFLHTHYQIPDPNNPLQAIASMYHLTEWDRDERSKPVRFPNGRAYLLWEIYLTTKQQYNISLVSP